MVDKVKSKLSAEEKSRRGKMSKRKGRSGEQQAAKLLTKIMYPNADGEVRRTPMSGAWHGVASLTGDLICLKDEAIDERFPFYWSVKWHKRETIPAFAILAGNFSVLKKWLGQAKAMIPTLLYYTLLFWKSDATEWYVCMDFHDYEQLKEVFTWPVESTILISKFFSAIPHHPTGLVNMPLSTFGAWITPGLLEGGVFAKKQSV